MEKKKVPGWFADKPLEFLVLKPEDWSEAEWDTILKLFGMESATRVVIKDYTMEAFGVPKYVDTPEQAYKFHVTETFEADIEITATSKQEALNEAHRKYRNGDIETCGQYHITEIDD